MVDKVTENGVHLRDSDDEIETARQKQMDYLNDGLSTHVMECLKRSHQFISSKKVHSDQELWHRNYLSRYSSEELAKFQGIDQFVGLTQMLCMTLISWMKEAYSLLGNKPWTIEPTVLPELPKKVADALDKALDERIKELEDSGAMDLIDDYQLAKIKRDLKQAAIRMAQTEADQASAAMSDKIKDQLQEVKFDSLLDEIITDFAIYDFAAIKGPIPREKLVSKWNGDSIDIEYKVVPDFERVAPVDLFLSPDSTTTQDGEYVIHRMYMSLSDLAEARKNDNASYDAINLILYDEENGGASSDHWSAVSSDTSATFRDPENPNTVVVYDFYGVVSGRDILGWYHSEDVADDSFREDKSTTIPENFISDKSERMEVKASDFYEIQAWICGGKVIMLTDNPHPLSKRPINIASYLKTPGSWVGRGVSNMIYSCQSEANVSVRSRVFNSGLASGPQVEIDSSRLDQTNGPSKLRPWDIHYTDGEMAKGGSQPAIKFYQPDSRTVELTGVIRDNWAMAHDVAGLPPHTRGVNDGAPRTLGAFSSLYDSTTKGVKRGIGNLDSGIIEPTIEGLYYYNLIYDEDDGIKGDCKVVVNGAVGLIKKEARNRAPLEMLRELGPMIQTNPEAMMYFVNQYFTEMGYDPAEVGTGESPNSLAMANSSGVPEVVEAPLQPKQGE